MARKRRAAEETRAEILEVARRHLLERGPDELRLDEIAREVGVSRQAVLHHFGNRDGLMRAVVEVAWLGLFRDLATLAPKRAEGAGSREAVEAFVDRVDDVARRRGNARLGGWLLLTGQGLPAEVFDGALSDLPNAIAPDTDDAGFRLLAVGAALFGDAIYGARLRQALGLPDEEGSRDAFRRWLAAQLLPT